MQICKGKLSSFRWDFIGCIHVHVWKLNTIIKINFINIFFYCYLFLIKIYIKDKCIHHKYVYLYSHTFTQTYIQKQTTSNTPCIFTDGQTSNIDPSSAPVDRGSRGSRGWTSCRSGLTGRRRISLIFITQCAL